MIEHHSTKIQNAIQKELFTSKNSIKIAVAWFTNNLLFQPLLMKLALGVQVTLVLNKDEVNNSNDNEIDFDQFIEAGGILHWNNTKQLMHDKFCVIDEQIVIFGSYNWTNKAEYNDESITIARNEPETVKFYTNKFKILTEKYPASESVKRRQEEKKKADERMWLMKEEEERRKKQIELQREQEEKQKRIAQERIEKERIRKEDEERKRKEIELESNEACYLDVRKGILTAGSISPYPVMDNGIRVIPGLRHLRESYVFIDKFPDNLILFYYGTSVANDPNLDPKKEQGVPCFKFKSMDGKFRMFITLDDFVYEDKIVAPQSLCFLKEEPKGYFDNEGQYAEFTTFMPDLLKGVESAEYYNGKASLYPMIESFMKKKWHTKRPPHLIQHDSIRVLADTLTKTSIQRENNKTHKIENYSVPTYVYKPKGTIDLFCNEICKKEYYGKQLQFEKIKNYLIRKKTIVLKRKELFKEIKQIKKREFTLKTKFSTVNEDYYDYKRNHLSLALCWETNSSSLLPTFRMRTAAEYEAEINKLKRSLKTKEEWEVEHNKLKEEFRSARFEEKWDVKDVYRQEYNTFVSHYLLELYMQE